jgi:hypothetical protein
MVRIVVTFNEDEFAFLQTTFNDAKTLVRHSPLANATLLALSRAQYEEDDAPDDTPGPVETDDSPTSDIMSEDVGSFPDSGAFHAVDAPADS